MTFDWLLWQLSDHDDQFQLSIKQCLHYASFWCISCLSIPYNKKDMTLKQLISWKCQDCLVSIATKYANKINTITKLNSSQNVDIVEKNNNSNPSSVNWTAFILRRTFNPTLSKHTLVPFVTKHPVCACAERSTDTIFLPSCGSVLASMEEVILVISVYTG